MANTMYDKCKESFISQNPSIDLDTDTIKMMLVKSGQAISQAHQFVSDLTGSNIVQRSSAITGKTVTSGVFNHSAVTFAAVANPGSSCNIVYYKDTGSDATSPLIAYFDTSAGGSPVALPVTPNGGDITVTPDTGTNKVFKL